MPRRMFTVQAKAVDKIVRCAAAHGVSADDLYRAVKLDPAVLRDPDNRIPFAQLVDLYEKSGGDPSLEHVAHQLGLTPRTLQPKLHEMGTSHNELLEQMRRQLAMRYLREREMAICEVAYLLGFSESSSFHRAFKRWTGVTPKEFRK